MRLFGLYITTEKKRDAELAARTKKDKLQAAEVKKLIDDKFRLIAHINRLRGK